MPLLTVDELALEVNMTPTQIRRRADLGQIHAFKIGRLWRFQLDEVMAAINTLREPVPIVPVERPDPQIFLLQKENFQRWLEAERRSRRLANRVLMIARRGRKPRTGVR
jgi:excisionase family DNA binding protein